MKPTILGLMIFCGGVLGLLTASARTAYAVPFAVGDVFAGTGSGTVLHFRPGTGLVVTYSTGQGGFVTGMAFDAAGNLYVTNFEHSNITRFDSTGTVIAPNPFVTNDAVSSNESIVFDASGNFYVGQADGTGDIIMRAADGTFLARYDVATENRGSDWIDLAADQTTMYYTSEGRNIMRYDVGSDAQLSTFATLSDPGEAYALRLLGDGGLLVAHTYDIHRLDSGGAVIQTYDVSGIDGWFALNLDPDGTTFWSADFGSGFIQQFDIASGSLLTSFDAQQAIAGLAVFGERTVGGGGSATVPEPSSLLLLGSGLAGLAWWRRMTARARR